MSIEFRPAHHEDCHGLAEMNRQLIEDEGSRNPMSLHELELRMRGWLDGAWSVVLVLADGQVAGYCVYQTRHDEYFPERADVYIRQFFIQRALRDQGIGQAAFGKLVDECFPPGAPLTLEVLESNPRGQAFWRKLGFQPYCTTYKR